MSRLADYFAVIAYNPVKQESGKSVGVIVQRFPATDWPNTPFTDGIEWFCQPRGWSLSKEQLEPKFYVSVLTDSDANRHYCASLCFYEPFYFVADKPSDEDDDMDDEGNSGNGNHCDHAYQSLASDSDFATKRLYGLDNEHNSTTAHRFYAPKCLVLVSRHDCFEIFQNCLGIVYTVYKDNIDVPVETLIGNILGCVQIPPDGGPQIRFSIGAGDHQSYQPPQNSTIPITFASVYLLFKQLGIRNSLAIFCAIMTEHKILMFSQSYTRLGDACRALAALMFPFRYNHVYIPLLPVDLLEVLSTPTPFLIGVDSACRNDLSDLNDVIFVDLDGGTVEIPDSVTIPSLPNVIEKETEQALFEVLQPDLMYADNAFSPASIRISTPIVMDKEIRAVFLRMFSYLLHGYRNCLTLVRIFPKPVITFHKVSFLGQRALIDSDFSLKLLNSMFFTNFVSERGCPLRSADFWDELCAIFMDLRRSEQTDRSLRLKHIQELAQQLNFNENSSSNEKIPGPSENSKTKIAATGVAAAVGSRHFPILDADLVHCVLQESLKKCDIMQKLGQVKSQKIVKIAMGPPIQSINENENWVINSTRKLDVLKQCISLIFENKIVDAKKMVHAVNRVLKSCQARLTLCDELNKHVRGNKAILEHQQFDLVVRLMNFALQYSSSIDEDGVAYAILPLATTFCRKLCTGVIQFAFTCIQDHSVWQNLQFWESAFYQDVQKDIRNLCINRLQSQLSCSRCDLEKLTALELAAEQMKIADSLSRETELEYESVEESTLYSQAIHYANRMVYLMVPLDVGAKAQKLLRDINDERSSIANSISMTGSDSVADIESSVLSSATAVNDFERESNHHTSLEISNSVIRTITRFVEKICSEGNVRNDHIQSLSQMIPGVVHMHIETLEAVFRESKRLPSVPKPKIRQPELMSGEILLSTAGILRAFLLNDGREEHMCFPEILPAEGAIFLTNYRIIFQGTPCDSELSEKYVIRTFPICSLTKEKRVSIQDMSQESLQLRSSTFQLLKIAFDEDVKSKNIEMFRKQMNRLRYPQNVFGHFAFTNNVFMISENPQKAKEKNSTLKRFAKKTLLRTAQRAGFKQKDKHQKNVFQTSSHDSESSKYLTISNSAVNSVDSFSLENMGEFDEKSSRAQTMTPVTQASSSLFQMQAANPHSTSTSPVVYDSKTLERSYERKYVKDWQRLGLCASSASSFMSKNIASIANTATSSAPYPIQFRISRINSIYQICKTYPSLLLVPNSFDDDSVRKLCKFYRHNRFPVVTWYNQKNMALLLRGASHLNKGVIDLLKVHHSSNTNHQNVFNDSPFTEQRKYFETLMTETKKTLTKTAIHKNDASGRLCSNMSPTSKVGSLTPKFFNRFHYLQLNNDSNKKSTLRLTTSVQPQAHIPVPVLSLDRDSTSVSAVTNETLNTEVLKLCMIGEKSQLKSMKNDSFQCLDFVSFDCCEIKTIKNAFKKLMRACIPSSTTAENLSFLECVEESGWLQQVASLLEVVSLAVEKIDKEGVSVAVCLEDGWDFTTQISALIQLSLDPFYRTIKGFRYLIEKEWIAFGHKFNQRGGFTSSNQSSNFGVGNGIAPFFLQFLDAVFQMQLQNPTAFEFNDVYLRFLAYHSVSARFQQFLFDSELERFECGILSAEDKHNSLTSHTVADPVTNDEKHIETSVFDFIEKWHSKRPIFYNYLFVPTIAAVQLNSNIAFLEIWDYYLNESLATRPIYDFDSDFCNYVKSDSERVVTNGIENVKSAIPNQIDCLLNEISKIENDFQYKSIKWKVILEKFETIAPHTSLASNLAFVDGKGEQDCSYAASLTSATREINTNVSAASTQMFKKKVSQKRNFFHLKKK